MCINILHCSNYEYICMCITYSTSYCHFGELMDPENDWMNKCMYVLYASFINITLGCNANAGKCTGISQCLVNSSKHSSGWYSMVRKTLLIFSYGLNWITVTKTVHINHICILCNWKCKWHRERNRRTVTSIRTGLTSTLHCRLYCTSRYETIALLLWT